MGLPIGTALFGLGIASALVALASNVISMPDFTTAMVAMIGLGVGIDYALFIVTRYRDGLKLGLDVEDAVAESIDTSGRAVLFAGITVIISLLGLTLIGLNFVTGVAIASAIGVLMMILGSLTPAPGPPRMGRPEDRQHVARRPDRGRPGRRRRPRRLLHRARARSTCSASRAADRVLRPQLRHQAAARAHPPPRRAAQGAALLVPLEPAHPAPAVAQHARRRRPAHRAGDPAVLDPPRASATTGTCRRARPSARPTT